MEKLPQPQGDSVIAGAVHEVEMWNADAGVSKPQVDPALLYSQVTAYEPLQRSMRADLREQIALAITGVGTASEDSWHSALRQADRVIDSLGLMEERRTNVMSSAGMTTDSKTGITTHHSDMRYDHRWVTVWKPC